MSTANTPIDVSAVAAACSAATPGPWLQGAVSSKCEKPSHKPGQHPGLKATDPCEYTSRIVADDEIERRQVSIAPNVTLIGWDENEPILREYDAAFIALARSALPECLDEIQRLRALVEENEREARRDIDALDGVAADLAETITENKRLRALVEELTEARKGGTFRTDELCAVVKLAPTLTVLVDPLDPYPAELVGQLARSVVALDKETDDMGRYNMERHVEYKKRRNAQFAAYELAHRATIAFLLDRAEQYAPDSGYRAFVDELVGGIASFRHVECAEAGEYDDMSKRIDRILTARTRA